jgi:hypothetical protein
VNQFRRRHGRQQYLRIVKGVPDMVKRLKNRQVSPFAANKHGRIEH